MEINIGKNIKRLRLAKNITQEQLSEAMNVSCAAVSKWERGDTYPDITLLQPLAYYFGVSLDELMGYDHEEIQARIDEVIENYRNSWNSDYVRSREIIVDAYRNYPNDYRVMHYYMWDIAGHMADNDPNVLLEHKDEFRMICDKILDGCTDESIRLNAWNMRAKILHAEGKTEEALSIYKSKYPNWFHTSGQKTEQLFAKNTSEYYFHVTKNMYNLAAFAGDKLARSIFFDPNTTVNEVAAKAIDYAEKLALLAKETNDVFFSSISEAFCSRIRNDLTYRGGRDEDIVVMLDYALLAAKQITQEIPKNEPLRAAFWDHSRAGQSENFLAWIVEYHLGAENGRRAELLNNPAFLAVLQKYRHI